VPVALIFSMKSAFSVLHCHLRPISLCTLFSHIISQTAGF